MAGPKTGEQTGKTSMNTLCSDVFLALASTLLGAGWKIVKFEDLGGGVTLTIVPHKKGGKKA